MNILIVDDEAPARKRLKRMIETMPDYQVVAEAKNGIEAIQLCDQLNPDIVLMDIRMPGMDGLEAAATIIKKQHPPAIIYCTAFSEHSLQAFETHAVGYLLKPINLDKLRETLAASVKTNQAQHVALLQETKHKEQSESRKHICAKVRGNMVLVDIDDIYYFQADQKYITVRYTDGEVLIEDTLLKLEKEFAQSFLRIHRNALVALDKVDGIHKTENGPLITFKAIDEELEISRRHIAGVRKILKNL